MCIECAQGVHPWRDAKSYYDLVVEIAECAAPPALPDDERFSAALRAFCAACLAPKPAERPGSHELLSHAFVLRPDDAVASAVVAIGGEADEPPPLDERSKAAARRLGAWLTSTLGHAYGRGAPAEGAPAAAVGTAVEAAEGAEERSARRIQAWLRGETVRRELAEIAELEEQIRTMEAHDGVEGDVDAAVDVG
jgi:hypothetical protein